ncbi:MAG: chromosomal replication initiator protein DnaA [Vicinamibacteraceae bacterium]
MTVWDQVLARVETKVNRHSFSTWFRRTEFVTDDGQRVTIRVPDVGFRDWLLKHYSGVLADALAEIGRSDTALTFVTEAEANTQQAAVERSFAPGHPASASPRPADTGVQFPVPGTPAEGAPPGPPGLNPRYTFDSFVVGPSNQFAHAACRAVAEAPARSYNPLFIYGGVGLGKTHLMHAVGHYIVQQARSLKLTYVSSERFMNEMINALRYERILDFRERYRNIDVLLVDDIQFIGGKESTQTEFFHTFNALFDSAKQIVISSDSPPHEITALEERLRSRFEWGLIADIQPPDLETKVAILRKKAEAEAVPLPDNVAIYIAGKIRSNVRELEGSLIRLVAYASMTGDEINLALAQHVLRNVLSNDERVITIEIIQKFVADYFQLRPNELKARNNSKSIALPRQVAMYMCKALTRASLPEIGRAFGGKHHSTVIHSIQKIEGMRQRDTEFSAVVQNLLANFQ